MSREHPNHLYYCPLPKRYPEEPHPRPASRSGTGLDWAVWRYVVDNGIKRPDMLREQVLAQQSQLQAQGEAFDGDIAHARRRLQEVYEQRAFYQRKASEGKMVELEFDARMDETQDALQYWQSEIDRLTELRDNATKIHAGLDYATELLTSLQARLTEIDQPPNVLRELPKDQRDHIRKERQRIIRALCDRIEIYADGRVKIYGVLDGSEAAQFDLVTPRSA